MKAGWGYQPKRCINNKQDESNYQSNNENNVINADGVFNCPPRVQIF